jgi:tetratricopeptide (TPR) repeat protein
MFKCNEPVNSGGAVEHYALNFAGNNNTRLSLERNGTQIASNENIIFEPDKKYHVVIECSQGEIQVTINARLVMSSMDRSPLAGSWVGFVHQGQPVIYSRIMMMTRGLPIKTETINIPEALMAEGCFDGAQRRFLEFYRNHRFRYMGNWAAYRAGIAAYRATHRRSEATKIWSQLKHSRYHTLEHLGMSRLELLDGNPDKAAKEIEKILNSKPPLILLRSVANFAQEHTQKLLDHESRQDAIPWPILERWIRITLTLDQKLDRRDPISLSLLWHWLFRIIQSEPENLGHALSFIRKTYGEGRGEFLELITNQDLLIILIKRSQSMTNHTFLIEKLMRLIIWHEDPIDDLETLGRFYLNSGHERIALQIFQHLMRICLNTQHPMPPAPCAYVGTYLWLTGNEKESRRIFKIMERNSTRWGPSDAQFFLGLDDYRRGRRLNAIQRWKQIEEESETHKPFRKLIARSLLGGLPPDPDEAGIPDRHDYRFLFCFFLGMRFFIDWKETKDPQAQSKAIGLFTDMHKIMKPSYDIYASTLSFARIPLTALNADLAPMAKPEVLSREEKDWLKKLVLMVKDEMRQPKT